MAKPAFILLFLLLLMAPFGGEANDKTRRVTVGYVEYVSIPALDIKLKAKLDTGAKTASIHANILEVTKKKNKKDKQHVLFTIETADGSSRIIKKRIVRWVRIKKKEKPDFIRRPVVEMNFCVAGRLIDEEVNLANREHFNYDLLIGRNMLEHGQLVVDASKTFTNEPNCPTLSKRLESSGDV